MRLLHLWLLSHSCFITYYSHCLLSVVRVDISVPSPTINCLYIFKTENRRIVFSYPIFHCLCFQGPFPCRRAIHTAFIHPIIPYTSKVILLVNELNTYSFLLPQISFPVLPKTYSLQADYPYRLNFK